MGKPRPQGSKIDREEWLELSRKLRKPYPQFIELHKIKGMPLEDVADVLNIGYLDANRMDKVVSSAMSRMTRAS